MKKLTIILVAAFIAFPLLADNYLYERFTNLGFTVTYENGFTATSGARIIEHRHGCWRSHVNARPLSRNFDPHWAGFGIGFNNFYNNGINHADGVSLSVGRSLEWTFNFFEHAFPFSRNTAFVTGLGMRWNRFHLSNNEFFDKVDGAVVLLPAEEGVHFTRTRMGVNSFTLPLLFEWQSQHRRRSNNFFVSAGVVCVFNYRSESRVRYVDERGRRQRDRVARDLYVRPLTVDFLLQAGFGDVGLYVRYSPMELFEKDRGPVVNPVSLGVLLHF